MTPPIEMTPAQNTGCFFLIALFAGTLLVQIGLGVLLLLRGTLPWWALFQFGSAIFLPIPIRLATSRKKWPLILFYAGLSLTMSGIALHERENGQIIAGNHRPDLVVVGCLFIGATIYAAAAFIIWVSESVSAALSFSKEKRPRVLPK